MSVAIPVIDSVDNVTKRIYLKLGVVAYHPIDDIYHEIRNLRRIESGDMRNYPPQVVAGGSVSKGGGKFTPRYAVFNDGYKVVPQDADHILSITGEQITDDGQDGTAVIDTSTLSAGTNVLINYTPPEAEIIKVSVGGALTTEENAQLFGISREVYIDTEAVPVGNGSQAAPFNNLTTAIDYAESIGCKNLIVYSDIILDRQLKNFKINGVGNPTVDCNGQDLTKSEFIHCKMQGTYIGPITVQESLLLNNFWLNGFFEKCALAGDLFCIDGSQVLVTGCMSAIAGLGRPTISMNGIGSSKLSLRKNSGGMTIKDCNNILDEVTVEVAEGSLTFDSSCTAGVMVARGLGKFVDESNGATVHNEMQSNINWLEVLEGTFTAQQMMRIMAAAAGGEASGLDINNPIYMALDKSKPRIAATTDEYGNRDSVTVDGD
jgi:hypothetical protein